MPLLNRSWQLVLLFAVLSSNIRSTVSQGCISLASNPNARFSASSSIMAVGKPVVHGNDVWCAAIPTRNQWLKVNLGFSLSFDQVFVQGLAGTNRSVAQYYLRTSNDDDVYVPITQAGGDRLRAFDGPWFNGDTVVVQNLSTPVTAQYVIFNPREPLDTVDNFMCMRIDILSCQNVPPAIPGGWTDWSDWTPCPPCSHSVTTRTRTCTDPAPAFGGSDCNGPSRMDQLCPTNNCVVPVDGKWSDWGPWSACSETCGNGTESRTRECNNPMPENNGADCVGPSIDSRNCFVQHCPVPGNWSSWSAWSPCSETCGNGTSTRTRSCDNPAPAHGGADCVGAADMSKDCSEQPCPATTPSPTATAQPPVVDGGWSDWNYSLCDAQCGPGKLNRTRTCDNPPPSGGGLDCLGPALETVDCTNGPCVDPNMPNIDLAFAISATSANSNQSYDLMKNTIKQFIDQYGVDKIHYSLIVYGDSIVRVVNFNHTFPPSASDLKAAIDAQPAISGGPYLEGALQEAFKVFNETEGRPDAKKVLVVMTDENSGADSNSLSTAVKPVEDLGVLVLSVGAGSAVDRTELSVISPNPLDVISPTLGENPSVLADRIMERILRRTIPLIDVGFGIRASEINSSAIFTVMTETRDTINQRYRPGQVQYSVIIYGNKGATSFSFDTDSALDMNGLIAAANQSLDVPGPIDLPKALTDAERLFQSHPTRRPNAKRVFIAITDTAITDNDTELISAGDALRRQGILVFSVNNTGDGLNAVTITQIDFLGFPTFTTVRSVVIAETIIKKALEVNMPLIDLTFAISATSISADTTFRLMRMTINEIISKYDIFRIHYSVIVFGSVATTPIDFSTNIPDKETLIRFVANLRKQSGPVDLVLALEDAKRVYRLQEVRPDARRFLVVIMDNQSVDNVDAVNTAVTDLDSQDVVIIGVSIGNSTNPNDFEIITKDPRHIINAGVNKSPVELAKEIIDAIFISVRTAGFSQWGDWTACTKSCRSGGVAGTQIRTRVCVKSRLGCIGSVMETRECNTEDCQGCEERGPLPDQAYQTQSDAPQPAAWARLNTSNPGASPRAWCANPDDVQNGRAYIQIDLGEDVDVFRVATKGQEFANQQSWVTSFFILYSLDGFNYNEFPEGGPRKDFDANTDPTSVVTNDVNVTTRFIRFYPLNFTEQPCMQASVFGCTRPSGPREGEFFNPADKTEIGILIALWILAGILSFLLLMACCYYCCWHVCCGRGKKRKGLTAYRRHTWIDETDGYLIEDLDKRWRLPAVDIVSSVQAVPEDEIQEVTVEMGNENPKPSGVIQFGIETEESQDSSVTADTVHSETPQYSEEVGPVKKGASMMTMSPADSGYRSAERRKRVKSETAASVLAAGVDSGARYVNSRRNSSGISNGAFDRSQDWLIEPSDLPQNRNRAELKRSQSADEMSTIDYGMFEQRPVSSQNAVRGELGRDGYMRMKQTSRERLDGANASFPMGTADVAIGGIEPPNSLRGTNHLYGLQEQELTFATDNGVCRREQWTAVGENGPVQLREEGFREIHVQEESPYAEIHFDDEGNILSYKP